MNQGKLEVVKQEMARVNVPRRVAPHDLGAQLTPGRVAPQVGGHSGPT